MCSLSLAQQVAPQQPYPQTKYPASTAQQQIGPQQKPQSAAQQQPAAPQGQQAAPPAAQQPAVAAQAPPGFVLNALQQAELNQVLDAWQKNSGEVKTFKCSFERWEYNLVFGPGQEIPLNKNKGELSFQDPDKGSFQVTEISTFQKQAAEAGQKAAGTWVVNPNAIGEHWVCDGQSIFEYKHEQKQLIERPLPANMRGKAIVDGPLPFLFGAEAAKLKERYWMRVEHDPRFGPDDILLQAEPRFQEQAADFRRVDVVLDRQKLLPKFMRVEMPNKDWHTYIFDLNNASVNNPLARIQQFFQRPRVPFGWTAVVENGPVAQAPQPNQQQR